MGRLSRIELGCIVAHGVALAFGLAGLLLVLPNPSFIGALPTFGQEAFGWSMAGGGVVYILLGTIAVSLFAVRTLGRSRWLMFMIPAIVLSLSSELLGTSTGFPFGAYAYLNGLGYKIAGLVPFTIPLSWFYVGCSCYVLARSGLERSSLPSWVQRVAGVAIGSMLLTAWDFVLDPAMSQTAYPFWEFQEVGVFFGMPYRNITGWLGTGILFMTVATALWGRLPLKLSRQQLTTPLVVYLLNFAFGAVITLAQLDQRFWVMLALSVGLGVVPAIALWSWVLPSVEATDEDRVVVKAAIVP